MVKFVFELLQTFTATKNRNMKAIRISEFGGPEVMKLEDIERPVPAADEILV